MTKPAISLKYIARMTVPVGCFNPDFYRGVFSLPSVIRNYFFAVFGADFKILISACNFYFAFTLTQRDFLAGFGDSYSTDDPFLKFFANQALPAGKPIAVFYGGNEEPEEFRGLFYQARHSATVSGDSSP